MKALIILVGIMLVCIVQTKAQETGAELNTSFSKVCESQASALKRLSFNKEAGPLEITVADGVVQAELDGKVFFSESLPKDWKKDNSAPKLSGATLGDKYIFVAEKLSGATEMYITDINKLKVTQVNMPGTITKVVFLSETGQILVQSNYTKVAWVFFNVYGDPVTIAVK
jgi:hypothetical protein